MSEYQAVLEHPRTGAHEIVFEGRPIRRVRRNKMAPTDNLGWGNNTAGATNTARTILEHAKYVSEEDIEIDTRSVMEEFRRKFVAPPDSDEEWSIDYSTVVEFLQESSERRVSSSTWKFDCGECGYEGTIEVIEPDSTGTEPIVCPFCSYDVDDPNEVDINRIEA